MAERLIQLSEKIQDNTLWDGDPGRAIRIVEKFYWDLRTNLLDKDLSNVSTC